MGRAGQMPVPWRGLARAQAAQGPSLAVRGMGGGHVPAGFDTRRPAHVRGQDQANGRKDAFGSPGFGGQMQAADRRQRGRAGQIGHHQRGRAAAQRFLHAPQQILGALGGEVQECSRRMKMGEDLPQAIHELPYRTGLITLNILVTALSVHQLTGGDLVSVLERLSQTIRDRLLFLGRLRAATVGSRATAVLMLALPVAIIIFFSLRDPLYVQKLMDSDMGRKVTLGAIAMEIVGSLFILRILQNSQRS